MATEAAAAQSEPCSAVAPAAAVHQDHIHDSPDGTERGKTQDHQQPQFLHSPPDSNNTVKSDATDSELSDLDDDVAFSSDAIQPPQSPKRNEGPASQQADESQPTANNINHVPVQDQEQEEDIGEVLPDDWSGAVPIFKPTWDQFHNFNRFMAKVNDYGMKSGIIKVIPPKEWLDKQPPLDDLIKHVRIREPIKQEIMGTNGTYRQVNLLHGRSYNVPSWRILCEQSEHQPPARRGERRANIAQPRPQRSKPASTPKPATSSPRKRGRGRPRRSRGGSRPQDERPMTPVSPKPEDNEEVRDTVENDPGVESDGGDETAPVGRMGGGNRGGKAKTQSTSARRKYSKREGSAAIDEAAFKDFNYRMDISDYTPERCEELERSYWKTLTFAPPLYGADMMGTLFDDRTETWNLTKLPNILDVLGTKVPGVNTAYLYFGMWKATFAWHLEDVDLYSINYLHFGAPKQWYSISQRDARRFEQAMKSIWPQDAKACDQFLRHKAFLISPQHLLQNYGIRVNKVVSYPGEFVVTYPYGYHSGYNLGYNCAEAVNFGLDSWLEMGKIAKKCECAQAQDSVWIDVHAIERRLRGEETEYEETDEDDDEDDDEEDGTLGLPSPPGGHGVKFKTAGRKRKRAPGEKGPKIKVKKIKLRIKNKVDPPCCLCPNDISSMELLPTDDSRKAHRICALYLPETYIETVDGQETVHNVSGIHKDRMDLKCLYCRSKRGGCFQCSQKKCARAYHPTCAAAAGVFVEDGEVPVFGEDGTEYKEQAFEFSCRFHRTRREKKVDGATLEDDVRIRNKASTLKEGDICQMQYYRGDIFAGIVVGNHIDEEMVLIDVIPNGDRIEVEWKWLLVPDPSDYHLPKASAKALPLPTSRKAKDKLNAKRSSDDERPRKGDEFMDGYVWAEFNFHEVDRNKQQVKIDFSKDDQIWHYLGRNSTEAKAQYTEDPRTRRHNPKGNYLDTLPKPPKPAPVKRAIPAQTHMPGHYGGVNQTTLHASSRPEKPYVYKPKKPIEPTHDSSRIYTSQRFAPSPPSSAGSGHMSDPYYRFYQSQHAYRSNTNTGHHYNNVTQHSSPSYYAPQRFEVNGYPSPYDKAPASNRPALAKSQSSTKASPPQGTFHHHHTTPNQSQPRVQQQYYHPTSTRPPGKQMFYPSIYQKYPFFHVNHNRDVTKYHTPYSPYLNIGFINGYQGNLRAHLLANKQDLLRRSNLSSLPYYDQQPSLTATTQPGSYSSPYKATVGLSVDSPRTPTSGVDAILSAAAVTAAPSSQSLHPAIKPQQRISASTDNSPRQSEPTRKKNKAQEPDPPSSPKMATSVVVNTVQAANKPKESPVPLPANFLRHTAMSSPRSTPGSIPISPSAQIPPTKAQPPSVSGSNGLTTVFNVHSSESEATGKAPPVTPQPNSQPARTVESSISKLVETKVLLPSDFGDTPSQAPVSTGGKSPPTGGNRQPARKKSKKGPLPVPNPDAVQEFADLPAGGSVEFMDQMLANLRRLSGRTVAA